MRLPLLLHAFKSGCMERLSDVLNHVFDILEFLDLLVRELNIKFVLYCDRNVDHINLVEAQLMPLRGELDIGDVLNCIVEADGFDDTCGDFIGIQVIAYVNADLPEREFLNTILSRFIS
jgi:hypothetical protein